MALLNDEWLNKPIALPLEIIIKPGPSIGGMRYVTVNLLVAGVLVAFVAVNPENTHLTEAAQMVLQKWLGIEDA